VTERLIRVPTGRAIGEPGRTAPCASNRQRLLQRILGVEVVRHRHALLVDEGGSTRATAADLVEGRHLGVPNRPRWRRIANGAGIIGDGEPNEIVELQNAGIVVPQREAGCVGESHQQQRFRGAVIAHEQQRLFGGECGEERGLERVAADNAERAEEGAGGGAMAGAWVLLATAAGATLRRIRGRETAMEIPPRRSCAERDATPAGVMSVVRFSGLL
jgi:hypothetical protein